MHLQNVTAFMQQHELSKSWLAKTKFIFFKMTQKRRRIVFSAQQRTSLDLSDQGGEKNLSLVFMLWKISKLCVHTTPRKTKSRLESKKKNMQETTSGISNRDQLL